MFESSVKHKPQYLNHFQLFTHTDDEIIIRIKENAKNKKSVNYHYNFSSTLKQQFRISSKRTCSNEIVPCDVSIKIIASNAKGTELISSLSNYTGQWQLSADLQDLMLQPVSLISILESPVQKC